MSTSWRDVGPADPIGDIRRFGQHVRQINERNDTLCDINVDLNQLAYNGVAPGFLERRVIEIKEQR